MVITINTKSDADKKTTVCVTLSLEADDYLEEGVKKGLKKSPYLNQIILQHKKMCESSNINDIFAYFEKLDDKAKELSKHIASFKSPITDAEHWCNEYKALREQALSDFQSIIEDDTTVRKAELDKQFIIEKERLEREYLRKEKELQSVISNEVDKVRRFYDNKDRYVKFIDTHFVEVPYDKDTDRYKYNLCLSYQLYIRDIMKGLTDLQSVNGILSDDEFNRLTSNFNHTKSYVENLCKESPHWLNPSSNGSFRPLCEITMDTILNETGYHKEV